MSLGAYLRVLRPHLQDALIQPATWTRLERLGDALPPVSQFIIECRLHGGDERADLSLYLPRFVPAFDESLYADPGWQHFASIARAWFDEGTVLHRVVRGMWLEFDETSKPVVPPPNLFFTVEPDLLTPDDVRVLLAMLSGRTPTPSTLSAIDNVLGLRPREARLNQLGVMLARRSDAIRFVISDMRGGQCVPWLERAGWRDSGERFTSVIRSLAPLGDRLQLGFDVGDAIGPRVAVECSFGTQLPTAPRWRALVEHLVAVGLCTQSKADAMLAWPGSSEEPVRAGDLPDKVRRLAPDVATSLFFREISHIKITCDRDVADAKVYLRAQHAWVDRQVLSSRLSG